MSGGNCSVDGSARDGRNPLWLYRPSYMLHSMALQRPLRCVLRQWLCVHGSAMLCAYGHKERKFHGTERNKHTGHFIRVNKAQQQETINWTTVFIVSRLCSVLKAKLFLTYTKRKADGRHDWLRTSFVPVWVVECPTASLSLSLRKDNRLKLLLSFWPYDKNSQDKV